MATPAKYATVTPSAFPEKDWTPSQVRAYITHILVTKHDLEPQAAKDTAAKWSMGRGWDFVEADWNRFKKVFGDDVGPYMYRTVREEQKAAWEKSPDAPTYYRLINGSHVLLAAVLMYALNTSQQSVLARFGFTVQAATLHLVMNIIAYRTVAPRHVDFEPYFVTMAIILLVLWIIQFAISAESSRQKMHVTGTSFTHLWHAQSTLASVPRLTMTMQFPGGRMEVPFPDKFSSPKQIRHFLSYLLETQHDLSADEAAEIAENWKMGRGSKLLSAQYDYFRAVFGDGVGPHLYNTVWDVEQMLWRQTPAGTAYNILLNGGNLLLLSACIYAFSPLRKGRAVEPILLAALVDILAHVVGFVALGPGRPDIPGYFWVLAGSTFFGGVFYLIIIGESQREEQLKKEKRKRQEEKKINEKEGNDKKSDKDDKKDTADK
ncbi:hypothetical protein PWT90_01708 [Aphanocladium album]|nr:hypothetical protein PWT90_01708 [Aphanocladium album]